MKPAPKPPALPPLPVTLDAGLRAELTEARSKLASVLGALEAGDKRRGELERKREAVAGEVAALEASVDPTDDDAVLRLTSRKQQLDLLERRLGEAEGSGADGTLKEAMMAVVPLVGRAMTPVVHALVGRITDAISPFCRDRDSAERLAAQTHAAFECETFARCPWRHTEPTPEVARTVLAELDCLIRGEVPWRWPTDS